ncbi:MAG: hypothetical protein ACLR2E_03675 [Lachnospiraceae bacterium]
MAFTAKSGKFSASINSVEVGCGDKKIVLGGENILPFYTFDAPVENAPKVGVEITDSGLENEPECVKKYYEGCETVADMAKRAASFEGVDFFKLPYGWRRSERCKQIYRRAHCYAERNRGSSRSSAGSLRM